jgi:hypothetical protein
VSNGLTQAVKKNIENSDWPADILSASARSALSLPGCDSNRLFALRAQADKDIRDPIQLARCCLGFSLNSPFVSA